MINLAMDFQFPNRRDKSIKSSAKLQNKRITGCISNCRFCRFAFGEPFGVLTSFEMTPRIMDSEGGGKLRLRRSFPPPLFHKQASFRMKRSGMRNLIMRQFEMHPNNRIGSVFHQNLMYFRRIKIISHPILLPQKMI